MAKREELKLTSFGIRVGREETGMVFSKFSDAFWSAETLATHGYLDVVIFDRPTGKPVQVIADKSELRRRRALAEIEGEARERRLLGWGSTPV